MSWNGSCKIKAGQDHKAAIKQMTVMADVEETEDAAKQVAIAKAAAAQIIGSGALDMHGNVGHSITISGGPDHVSVSVNLADHVDKIEEVVKGEIVHLTAHEAGTAMDGIE